MNNFKDKKLLNSELSEESRFLRKQVLIFGLGVNQGGVGAARFFAQQGSKVKVTDLKTSSDLQDSLDQLKEFPSIEYTLGEHSMEDIDWADLIIKNPGVKPDSKYLKYAQEKNKTIDSDIGIFFQLIPSSQIIGVTGTKGKSTTATLIYEALKNSGVDVVFGGNIGKSVFDILPHISKTTIVILEISSYQLEAMDSHHISPHWAVITNIYPDHISFHGNMDSYIQAKKIITKYQTSEDFLFLNQEGEITNTPKFKNEIKSQIITFTGKNLPKGFDPKIPGNHNRDNFACALEVAKTFGAESQTILNIFKDFQGVEFRLQLIKEWNGVKIYNDTTSTSPQAAIENIKTLKGCIWIGGGVNKNLPYGGLAQVLDQYTKSIYFLEGDASEEIKKELRSKTFLPVERVKGTYSNLEELLQALKLEVTSGDVVLFSPGAASFNLFKNEFDRGRIFNSEVEKVFKN